MLLLLSDRGILFKDRRVAPFQTGSQQSIGGSQCRSLLRRKSRHNGELFLIETLRERLLDLLIIGEEFASELILPLKPLPHKDHLVFMLTRMPGHAASDVAPLRTPRAKGDMNVEVIRVVMEPVGVANRVSAMEFFGETTHHFSDAGNHHLVGADPGLHEGVVLLGRHRKDEAMCDDGALGLRAKSIQMEAPRLGDPPLSFLIGKLAGRGAAAIGIATNRVVQKSPGVNLADRFLGGVVHKSLQLLAHFFVELLGSAERGFSSGCLIEIFQIEPSSGRRLVLEDEAVLHESSSRNAMA